MADIDLSPKINCVVGNNGVGKTNLLDAIYYLSFCKSALGALESQIVRHDCPQFQIQGQYNICNDKVAISCLSAQKGKKHIKRNKKEYRRLSEHIGLIPLVMVSPYDSELIHGGSEERRKFMDMIISQYDTEYLSHLIKYNKALAQRNTLLKDENQSDTDMFLVWEETMSKSAEIIYNRRRELIERLVPQFNQFYSRIAGGEERVNLSYMSQLSDSSLSELLEKNREREHIVGYSLYGTHRDDLIMELSGYPIKREGSQGQSKSFLTALKFAQYTTLSAMCNNRKPILLLDDIFDKLDSERVARILQIVAEDMFGQIFITDVNRNSIETMISEMGCKYRVFTIEDGVVG